VDELEQIILLLQDNPAHEEAFDLLLSLLQACYGVKQEGSFYIRNREEISGLKNLKQQTDVLDTWFSSGLWPFSSM